MLLRYAVLKSIAHMFNAHTRIDGNYVTVESINEKFCRVIWVEILIGINGKPNRTELKPARIDCAGDGL